MASSRAPSGTNVNVGKVGGVVRMLAEPGLGTSERYSFGSSYSSSSSGLSSSKDGQEPGSVCAPLPAACAASDYKPSPRPRLTVLGLSNADAAATAASQEKAQGRTHCGVSDLPDYATAVHYEQDALPAQRCALLSRRFPSVRIARVAPVIIGSA